MNQYLAMTTFVAVANSGSFSAASRKLGISATAVSRHVADLEEMLGITLLRRTTRSVSLTETGASYLPRASAILDELELLNSRVARSGQSVTGRLRITAPPAIGRDWIAPLALEFVQSHPEIELELNLTEHVVELVGEGYDAAIRSGRLPSSSLIAHRIVDMRYVLCASPGYIDRKGLPTEPSDVARHECVHWFAVSGRPVWVFVRDGNEISVPIRPRLQVSDFGSTRSAAFRGLGLVVQPLLSVQEDLAAGRLVWVLPEYEISGGLLSLVRPQLPFEPTRLRAFIDFITRALREKAREPAYDRVIATP